MWVFLNTVVVDFSEQNEYVHSIYFNLNSIYYIPSWITSNLFFNENMLFFTFFLPEDVTMSIYINITICAFFFIPISKRLIL